MAILAFLALAGAITEGMSATAVAIGAAVATTVGGFIDSQFLFPAIFGTPSHDMPNGPRITSIPVMSADEGTPIPYCWGPQNRVGATLIWLSDLKEKKHRHHVGGGKSGGGSYSSYTYAVDMAVALCAGPIYGLSKGWTDGKVLFEQSVSASISGSGGGKFDSATLYLGTDDQEADPFLESKLGAGNVPAFRGMAYIVFENFQLADYGNRIPQLSFEVAKTQNNQDLSEVINGVLETAGLPAEQYDTSRVTACCLRGYAVNGSNTSIDILKPLLVGYDILVQERGGTLSFFNRQKQSQVTVPEDLLGAYAASESATPRFTLTSRSSTSIASAVNVKYIDVDKDLQAGTQEAQRINKPGRNVSNIEIPISLTAKEANEIATRILWRGWAERQQAELNLPPSKYDVYEGDYLEVVYAGETYHVRVDEVTKGANYLLEVKGVVEDLVTLTPPPAIIENSDYQSVAPYAPPTITLYILNLPGLISSQVTAPGFYAVVAPQSLDGQWKGSQLFKSPTNTTNYALKQAMPAAATMGTVVTAFGVAGPDRWDYGNEITVQLGYGELESQDTLSVLSGQNSAYVDGEIISFQTAELLDTGKYKLSGLLRGRRNSPITSHAAASSFILLDNAVNWCQSDISFIGTAFDFKGVAYGASLSDADPQEFTYAGDNLKPFPPCHIAGVRDGSNNLTISWIRRTRSTARIFSQYGVPLVEPTEKYKVEILSGSTVLRTLEVTEETDVTYTAAQQTTDGLTPGSAVDISLYQVSATIGKGFSVEVTL